MNKVLAGVGSVLYVVGSFVCMGFAENTWQEASRGIINVRSVAISPDNPKAIFIGAGKNIYKSEDGGNSWRSIYSIGGVNQGVNFLLLKQDNNSLYAATTNGAFCSTDKGIRWNRIFKGNNAFENECTAIAALPYGIFLGTKSGLFFSPDKGRTWHKETGNLGSACILNIAYNPKEINLIYVASSDGVFKKTNCSGVWERIFVAHPVENEMEQEEQNEDRDEEERCSGVRYIATGLNNLYLATEKGVYRSKDRGLNWELLSCYGLLSREVKNLLIADNFCVYAVTHSGIFEYSRERWKELSFGLMAEDVKFLAADKQNNLYAATEKGLFKFSLNVVSADGNIDALELYFKDEPKINELRQAAMKYAEVEPEKIIKWRKLAATKALLPRVSAGAGRNSTDLWHWETGSTTKNDDDILRRGDDSIDWDISLSWDLGELIWNNDQTSIDTRSRLMVQLRGDILDEVNKTYFERIRLKTELDNIPLEDSKKRLEKELRIKELTASLDGLTGGYFSQAMKHNTEI